jgi:hypothetical protein
MCILTDIAFLNARSAGLAAILLAATAFFSGCDTTETPDCTPACTGGRVCDAVTKSCVSPQLTPFEGAAPGRSVRLGVVDGRAYLAAIEPEQGLLLIGAATASEPPEMYVLGKLARPAGKKLALATSSTTVAVAWLGSDSRYRVAIHRIEDAPNHWSILDSPGGGVVEGSDVEEYRGSEHFDLAVDRLGMEQGAAADGSQRLRLVFHDARTHALRELSAPLGPQRVSGTLDWDILTIDDPAEQRDEMLCPQAQRERVGLGLGYEPDIISRAGSTYVAYRDADCGDLRLARRFDGKWRVSVVDTGDFEREDDLALTRGVTGKFASIAVDSQGNLAIAYFDATRGQLVVAVERAGRFITEVADPGFEIDASSRERKHLVGGFASLIFDADDIPWIAYMDATTARLRLAHRTRKFEIDGRWVQRTLDAAAPTGFSASMGFSAELGMIVVAEHLQPGPDGVDSSLHFLDEESL